MGLTNLHISEKSEHVVDEVQAKGILWWWDSLLETELARGTGVRMMEGEERKPFLLLPSKLQLLPAFFYEL